MNGNGIAGMTAEDLHREAARGGRFLVYGYCVSIGILTFRRSSAPRFVTADRSPALGGLPFSLVSLIVGWWGIPWGPIFTVSTVVTNFRGGTDVTQRIMAQLPRPGPPPGWTAATGDRPPWIAPGQDPTTPAGTATPASPGVAPGWYPDPAGRYQHRWWDGTRWTDQAASNGIQVADAL